MDKRINYTEPDDDFDSDAYWRQVTGRDEKDEGSDQYWHSFSDHGFANKNDPDYGPIPEEFRSNGMSRAAFACGILSLIAIFFNASLIFGALGLLFALLSRERKFSRQAKTAITLSVAGIAVFVVTVAISIFALMSMGIWDDMVAKVQQVDPSDPNAISDVQTEILQELQNKLLERYYGLGSGSSSTGSSAGNAAGSAGTDGVAASGSAGSVRTSSSAVNGTAGSVRTSNSAVNGTAGSVRTSNAAVNGTAGSVRTRNAAAKAQAA